jgi:hypothetical protein
MPFSPSVNPQKGITREPTNNGHIDAVAREKLLNAITRASRWVEAVRSGEAKSFDEIAAQEQLGERHVRWLTPLAFVSPRILSSIVEGTAPAGMTIGKIAKALPHCWRAQDKTWIGVPSPAGKLSRSPLDVLRAFGPANRAEDEKIRRRA